MLRCAFSRERLPDYMSSRSSASLERGEIAEIEEVAFTSLHFREDRALQSFLQFCVIRLQRLRVDLIRLISSVASPACTQKNAYCTRVTVNTCFRQVFHELVHSQIYPKFTPQANRICSKYILRILASSAYSTKNMKLKRKFGFM